ncbi:IS630 family transposase, partial [Xenorhabdus bovienii]
CLWQSLHETVTRNHCCQFMGQLLEHVKAFMEITSLQQQKPGRVKMGVSSL